MESATVLPHPSDSSTPATGPERADALWPAAAKGDREAANELAACTYRFVFAALCKLAGDRELAADLTQETYRKAWAALPRFRGASAVSSWLYRIAYTTYLNHLRRPARIEPLDDLQAERLSDPQPPPDDTAGRREAQERLRRAVRTLPDELAFAVTARYWGEIPVREIALEQGISEVAVRKRLRKALGLLASTLEEPS